MSFDKSVSSFFGRRKEDDDFFKELFKDYLRLQSMQKDAEISKELMRKLVMEHSKSEKRLRDLNELKNKFLSMAAHDLRNPLVSVQGFSELLLMGTFGEMNDQQKEYVEIMNTSAVQMLALVNDLLDYSLIERAGFQLNKGENDLNEIISASIVVNKKVAEKKDITIEQSLSRIPALFFDKIRISQVVDNLISNAVKFSPLGSRVVVFSFLKDSFVYCAVADEGPGVSDKDLPKLFKEFEKLDNRPTGGEKSTGLGLAMAKKIAESHDGDLQYKPNKNTGSIFYFKLPVKGDVNA